MFTSRAEYRLQLRADNADQRLTPKGIIAGCVGGKRRHAFLNKAKALDDGRSLLRWLTATPAWIGRRGIVVNQDGQRRNAAQMLSHNGVDIDSLATVWTELESLDADVARQLQIEARYAAYLDRQMADIRAFRRDESLRLPAELDFSTIPGLSAEVTEKLSRVQPATLGAASRISGVTPAALTLLLGYVRRQQRLSA